MEDDQLRLIQEPPGGGRGGGTDPLARRRAQRRARRGRHLPAGWRLDRDTRARGIEGVRRAREILEAVTPPDGGLKRAS